MCSPHKMIFFPGVQLFSPCFFSSSERICWPTEKKDECFHFRCQCPHHPAFLYPCSRLPQSRYCIKLVIAYDPARHNSHSGGPCYMNELWWNSNIYAHTFPSRAFLIIASTLAQRDEQLSFDKSNYIEGYTNAAMQMPGCTQTHHTDRIQVGFAQYCNSALA